MLESEFYCSKLDILTLEKTAVQDEVEITKSLVKLYVAKLDADILIRIEALKVSRNVVKSINLLAKNQRRYVEDDRLGPKIR